MTRRQLLGIVAAQLAASALIARGVPWRIEAEQAFYPPAGEVRGTGRLRYCLVVNGRRVRVPRDRWVSILSQSPHGPSREVAYWQSLGPSREASWT